MSSAALAGSENPSKVSAQAIKRVMTVTIGIAAFIVARRRDLVALLAAVLLSACGTLPRQVERPFAPAKPASADSPLVRIANDSSPAPTMTGFRLAAWFLFTDAGSSHPGRARNSTSSTT